MAFGTQEILIIAAIALLILGPTAIPKLARSFGRAQGEFSKARTELEKEVQAGAEETGPSEEQIRRTARELGIDESDLDLDGVKKAINEKVG